MKVVNYLLPKYATVDIIARAMKELESYKQPPGVSVALYTKRLYTKVLRWGIVYEKKGVK